MTEVPRADLALQWIKRLRAKPMAKCQLETLHEIHKKSLDAAEESQCSSRTAAYLLESPLKPLVAQFKGSTDPAAAALADRIITLWSSKLLPEDKAKMKQRKQAAKRKRKRNGSVRDRERTKCDAKLAPVVSTSCRRKRPRLSALEAMKMSSLGSGTPAADSTRLCCPLCRKSQKSFSGTRGLRLHLIESNTHQNLARSDIESALKSAIVSPDPAPTKSSVVASLCDALSAARRGDVASLRLMPRDRVQAAYDRHGSGPLHWAAGSGSFDTVRYLISEVGLKPNEKAQQKQGSRTRGGRTPLHWAARNGHTRVAEFLIRDCGVAPDATTFDGSTALHLACYGDHLETAKALCAVGASPCALNSYRCGCTHWAAMGGALAVARWLVNDLKLDFAEPQSQGHTPLHKAALKNQSEIVDFLVDTAPVALTRKDMSGMTPLDLAEAAGSDAAAAAIRAKRRGVAGSVKDL